VDDDASARGLSLPVCDYAELSTSNNKNRKKEKKKKKIQQKTNKFFALESSQPCPDQVGLLDLFGGKTQKPIELVAAL